jgi:GR25 family glycosyltransferase involved in LPS biosynthesis
MNRQKAIEVNMTKAINGWDFFDRIYCISLEAREDRRQVATQEFARVGLAGKVEFVLVQPHPSNIEQGMYESHMTCLRKGLEAGAKSIVVFEDDVIFDRFNEEHFGLCVQFLKVNPNWKVLLLGALIRSSKKTDNRFIQKVRYQSLAHAYALNRHYAETLAYQPWQGIVIDTIFRPLDDNIYAVYPMFAFQNDFTSDNDKKYKGLERFRRWCGGLERIQKANEFYQRHKFGVIAVHVAIILLVLITLLSR